MKAIIVPRAFDCEPAWEVREYRLGSQVDDPQSIWLPIGSMFLCGRLHVGAEQTVWVLWYRVRLNAEAVSTRVFNTYGEGMPIPRCAEHVASGVGPGEPLHLFEFPAGARIEETEMLADTGSLIGQMVSDGTDPARTQRVAEAWRQSGVRTPGRVEL